MTWDFLKKRKWKKYNNFVAPDEIILDSTNLGNFDQQQFEVRIERPIRKRTILAFGIFFMLFMVLFAGRLFILQIKEGEAYFKRSENNTLSNAIIFAERGIIYDR